MVFMIYFVEVFNTTVGGPVSPLPMDRLERSDETSIGGAAQQAF